MVDSRIGENLLFSVCLRVSFLRVGGRMLHGERENEKQEHNLTWTIALSVFSVLFPFIFPFAVPFVSDILRLTETLAINHFDEKTENSIGLKNKMVRAFAFGMLQETWAFIWGLAIFLLFINSQADLDVLCSRSFPHEVNFKGAVSRNSAKLGNYKMPVKLRET